MPLRLLLDENMSPTIADQVRRHRPELVIESVQRWREGAFKNCHDKLLLMAAASEGWTLVTYDLATIPDIIEKMAAEGQSHSGVILIDRQTIANSDFGTLTRALISFWERYHDLEWRDCLMFLDKPPPL